MLFSGFQKNEADAVDTRLCVEMFFFFHFLYWGKKSNGLAECCNIIQRSECLQINHSIYHFWSCVTEVTWGHDSDPSPKTVVRLHMNNIHLVKKKRLLTPESFHSYVHLFSIQFAHFRGCGDRSLSQGFRVRSRDRPSVAADTPQGTHT